MDIVTLQAAKADAGKHSVRRGIAGLSPQGWSATPVDASSAVNAAIAAAHADLAAQAIGAQMEIVLDAPGVLYGSFEMATGVSLRLGPSTILAAMPSQSSSVVDYHSLDALHTTLRGGRIFGNYRNSATARCVDMTSSSSDAYIIVPPGQPSPQPDFPEIDDTSNPGLFAGKWTNPYNVLADTMVYDCGGDVAVIIGVNQRAAMTHNLFVQNAKGIGVLIKATDSMHMNMDVGVCGDCIVVQGIATKIMGFKAWYAGRNTGFTTGGGDGLRVEVLDPSTGGVTVSGEVIAIGETNDNNRYGWCVAGGGGHVLKGTSAGDANACVYVGQINAVPTIQNCDIDIRHSKADLGGPGKAVWLGAGGSYNTINVGVDPSNVGAGFVPVNVTGGASLANEDVTVHFGQKRGFVDVGVVTGTYNPPQGYAETLALTANTAVTIGASVNKGYRRRFTLRITTGASGSITWDSSWGNAPYIPPSSTVTVTFINLATTSATPTWVAENVPTDGGWTPKFVVEPFIPPDVVYNSAAWTVSSTTSWLGSQEYNSTNAQNDGGAWYVDLVKGTYRMDLLYTKLSSGAVHTWDISFDNGSTWTTIGTADSYAAATAGAILSVAGINVPSSGRALIRVRGLTRNASNTTGWFTVVNSLKLKRTA